MAAMPRRARATALGHAHAERAKDWLTEEHVDSVLRLVARRLGVDTLNPAQYRAETEAMVRADRARWLHGGQLRLPNPDQVEACAGSWDRTLAHAGPRARPAPERGPRRAAASPRPRPSSTSSNAATRPMAHRPRSGTRKSSRARTASPTRDGRRVAPGPLRRGMENRPPRTRPRCPRGAPAKGPAPRLLGGRRRRPSRRASRRQREDFDECVDWVARYLGQLGRTERASQLGYNAWAAGQDGAPWSSVFRRRHNALWSTVRDAAWERLRG